MPYPLLVSHSFFCLTFNISLWSYWIDSLLYLAYSLLFLDLLLCLVPRILSRLGASLYLINKINNYMCVWKGEVDLRSWIQLWYQHLPHSWRWWVVCVANAPKWQVAALFLHGFYIQQAGKRFCETLPESYVKQVASHLLLFFLQFFFFFFLQF